MSVTIEDAHLRERARDLADRLGVSLADAIDIAVRDKLALLPAETRIAREDERAAALLRLGALIGKDLRQAHVHLDDNDLYDPQGMPR